ncbi:MAG: phage minor head protein [Bryobacteraceae bacterium]
MIKLRAPGRKAIKVSPIRPSAAEESAYRARLNRMIDTMHSSVMVHVQSAWKDAGLAMDADPHAVLKRAMAKLGVQWQKTFDSESKNIAEAFANGAMRHGDLAFTSALRKSGFSVKFQTDAEVSKALDSAVGENIKLIKSIPQEYMDRVSKGIRESIDNGRNMGQLTKDLQNIHGMTKRRAALIARDQNNKATALIHRVRQRQVGITRAQWVHTVASVHPREEHAAWSDSGETYDINEGMYSDEDGEFVWPGTPINCGCISMSIVPGSEED